MTQLIKFYGILFVSVLLSNRSCAQKIEYGFGQGSDVVDSIQNALNSYKPNMVQTDLKRLNLYIAMDYCDGNMNVYVSEYAKADEEMARLIKSTNRFIRINKSLSIPIAFDTDILVNGIRNTRSYMNLNGYYISARRDVKGVWKVVKTQILF